MDYNEVTRALEKLGLEQYINEFKRNLITDKAFVLLTREDLVEIVPTLGHRLQILRAIDILKSGQQDSRSQAVDDEKSIFSASLLDEKEMEDRGLRCVGLFENSSFQLTPKRKGVRKNPRVLQFTPNKTDNQDLMGSRTPAEFQQDGPTLNQQNSNADISGPISQPNFVFETPPFAPILHNVQYIQLNNQSSDTGRNNIYGFNIEEILLADENVRRIINSKIPSNGFILRSDRQAIAGVLIKEIIRCLGTCPSKKAMEQLARHLVQRYPSFGDPRRPENGWEMWFFHTHMAPSATGFLEERLKSQRKKMNAKTTPIVDIDIIFGEPALCWDSDNEDDNPEPDEAKLEFMRQNVGVEVKKMMTETAFQRRTIIRRHFDEYHKQLDISALAKLAEMMRPLFDTEGMIIQDFNIRHPSIMLVLYERWPKVAKLLVEYAEKSGVKLCKVLDISKSRYDFTNDDYQIVGYCLLPFIMPSTGRRLTQEDDDEIDEESSQLSSSKKARKDPKKKRKLQATVKASDLDALRSLILFKPKSTSVAEVIHLNKKLSPFILALGSTINLEFESFFVILQKIVIPCGEKFMKALDTCFKLFTVLYIPLPLESLDLWMFIVYGVGGKPFSRGHIPPVVQSLIGQILPKI
ncbi:uncharacterized protein LOC118436483 isoform X2 [Folsomia candida]|uniref:uncharacterized protein LOC118436483 isoform X2 n=1 Tax=Folsomia candida TaxID=158441 RepID=UPI001604A78D|nr:uncharacterized protein LOC118436483 isoform X2 [Folsomia candida]